MDEDDPNYVDYYRKPSIQVMNKELFSDISERFQKHGYYVYSLNYRNSELNLIFNRKNISTAPFLENSEERELSVNISKLPAAIHKNIDLHGYSRQSAAQALRRIFNCSDRRRLNIIKIDVGRGLHSQNRQVLPDVVRDVARELDLPEPIHHPKNEGFMIMILPIKNDLNESNGSG